MKIAVLTVTYREGDLIQSVIENWKGHIRKHLVIEAKEPWQGLELPEDDTRKTCESYDHVEYVRFNKFNNETEQRNWGLGRLYDYDYVLIVDADEIYTAEDKYTILSSLGKNGRYENLNCYRANKVCTYFKTPYYKLDPPDTHKPVIAVNPKKVIFSEHRVPDTQCQIPLDVTLHHLSYLRSNERMFHKIQQFMHFDLVKEGWFKNVWMNWNDKMENVRAYGEEKSKAVPAKPPQEVLDAVL
jgi:hypothetical protein